MDEDTYKGRFPSIPILSNKPTDILLESIWSTIDPTYYPPTILEALHRLEALTK